VYDGPLYLGYLARRTVGHNVDEEIGGIKLWI
jgi:hypothetical protein